MNKKLGIFFAYESGHAENLDSMQTAINVYNSHQSTYYASTWETLNVCGNILNASVLKAIDECSVFACDLTYLNHNVLFEFGYAIGKQKELLVLLNTDIHGARETYEQSRILRNIGYQPFRNGNDVLSALQRHEFKQEVSVTNLVYARADQCDTVDLLYLESPLQTQASLDVKAYLSSADGRVIINDTTEVEYQTLSWYVASLVQARSVIIHLLGRDTHDQDLQNEEYSFFAGVAAGLGKKVALVAPKPFRAPIDYGDILIEYESSQDCVAKIDGWYKQRRSELVLSHHQQIFEDVQDSKRFNLLKLGIGYEMAEEEVDLLSYFIEVETYIKATRRNTSIITGRKGSGKTAIFIKLKDDFTERGRNSYTVILRPEADELLDDVELSKLYRSVSSRQSFLSSVWRYVILSQLAGEISRQIKALPSFGADPESIETRLVKFVQSKRYEPLAGHFTFIARLYRDLDEKIGFGNQRTLENLYTKYIGPLQKLLQEFFSRHSFAEINVLADNLDKTWDAEHGLDLQADMILSLLSFNDRIATELGNAKVKPHTVVFLRNDIFEYILDRAREPDKLIAKRREVDWHNFPERLRELIEARFRYSLQRDEDSSVKDVWDDYFRLGGREHPFDIMRKIIVSRPRDFIFFLSKMFESAVNRNCAYVERRDFEYALDAYSNYLYRNMIAETRARFPLVVNILKEVQKSSQDGSMEYRDISRVLTQCGLDTSESTELLRFLYEKSYIYAYLPRSGRILPSFSAFDTLRQEKRMFFFSKHKISLQILPSKRRLLGRATGKIIKGDT